MKDIIQLVSRDDVHEFCMQLWRTPEFRESHVQADGYIRRWIERFAEYPRFFFTLTEPRLEKAHFAPWWNGIGTRVYENPVINDLFYLHEIAHACMLVYDATMSWESWASKMADNEMLASLESESLAYFALPGLRGRGFEGEIWADRFLDGPSDAAVSSAHRSFMLMERYRARLRPDDALERRIAAYREENDAWALIWRDRFREVESAMQKFRERAVMDRAEGLKWLLLELDRHKQGKTGTKDYPWPDEAAAFAEVYWRTRDASNVIAAPRPTLAT